MGIQSDFRDHLLPQPASFKKKKEYQLHAVLGRGGFGKVLQATWTPKGGEKRDVALKIIKKQVVKDNDQVASEINVLKGLEHPHIVHLWDFFESRDKYYLAFELAVGGDLFDRVSARGKFVEKDASDCIRQVLLATAYLHSHRVVHRDLKPENIIFKTKDPQSPLVLCDFGIAKLLSEEEGEADEESPNVAGSLAYIAPEALLGKPQGRKVDCWAIGVIAYVLLCGYQPFRTGDKNELVREMMRGKITFHERYWRKVSETAKEFIKAMLQVDPAVRLSADDALKHSWLLSCDATAHNLAPALKEHITAKKRWNKAFLAISAANRLRSGPNSATTNPALPAMPTPSQSPTVSPSASIGSVSDPGTAAFPVTPSSASRLEVPSSSPDRPSAGGVTPLSMSEDETDGFVTADEESGATRVAAAGVDEKKATADRKADREAGRIGGGDVVGEKEKQEPVTGGLKGMMGRLGLGR